MPHPRRPRTLAHPRRSSSAPADPNAEQQEIARRRAVSAAALARTTEETR
ncbi:hypothetical protein [Streptomyces albidoflavus]|nr:hypothetical protein [Streptomyces albidoflavus]